MSRRLRVTPVALVAGMGALLCAGPASATFLDGTSITTEEVDFGTVKAGPFTVTAPGSVQPTGSGLPGGVRITYSDTMIKIQSICCYNISWGRGFVGFVFTDDSVEFGTATLDAARTSSTISLVANALQISDQGHQLSVDLANNFFSDGEGTTVTIDVTPATVAEPASLACLSGSAALLAWRRRRRAGV